MTRVEQIRAALQAALAPTELDVVDDSARHAGHAGARDGRGHFNVRVVSAAFVGKPPLARHRAVYAAVGEMMQTDIHALSIKAFAPGEAGSPGSEQVVPPLDRLPLS
ncbi:BolA family protein [Xanthomonas oryzae]|uniref:BolA family protein n=1 Tax=Xanthomonas oryzae TaxID=347 RepID=UPI0006AC5ED0|nr:BolA family protein [Xanthomonas oryzae]QBG88431.1 BolA family transcriptional regulator [Xanthomonas oryzae]QBG91965.1 BolA family transcriptional regulator [Xanthomonas oryzae]QBG95824.1 BolA family transcriptional regulator [Xanthomonas oryzae]QBH03795.1 BolA family transcriptional regulator [Xanthomonas oryzae]